MATEHLLDVTEVTEGAGRVRWACTCGAVGGEILAVEVDVHPLRPAREQHAAHVTQPGS